MLIIQDCCTLPMHKHTPDYVNTRLHINNAQPYTHNRSVYVNNVKHTPDYAVNTRMHINNA